MTQPHVTRRCRQCRVILDSERSITFCSPECQRAYEQRTGWTNEQMSPMRRAMQDVHTGRAAYHRVHGIDRRD